MVGLFDMRSFLVCNLLSVSIRINGLSPSPSFILKSRAITVSGRYSILTFSNTKFGGRQQLLSMNAVDESASAQIATVEEVLQSISNSDAGANASNELQKSVSIWSIRKSKEYADSLRLLNEVEDIRNKDEISNIDHVELTALDDENLFGNYDVAFVSTLTANKQQGNPAGGNFRGSFGRSIYQNEGIYQHILKEDDINYDDKIINIEKPVTSISIENIPEKIDKKESLESVPRKYSTEIDIMESKDSKEKSRILAINYITGKLFKVIPVSVILKGVISKIKESERTELTAKYGTPLSNGTVRADFESPLISIGKFSVRIGPNSNVVLDTPYLDKKIRLGLGARGSAFIFKKTDNEKAENWKIDIQRKPLNAKKLGFSFISLGILLFNLFSSVDFAAFQFVKNGLAFFLVSCGSIFAFTKGGIRSNDNVLTLKEKKK